METWKARGCPSFLPFLESADPKGHGGHRDSPDSRGTLAALGCLACQDKRGTTVLRVWMGAQGWKVSQDLRDPRVTREARGLKVNEAKMEWAPQAPLGSLDPRGRSSMRWAKRKH